jgi:hypothetical protein
MPVVGAAIPMRAPIMAGYPVSIGLWPVDDIIEFVTKPVVYVGAVVTGGLPGLAVAYASDEAGVLNVLEDMLKTAGGIAVGWLSSPLFSLWCNAAEWVAAKFGGGGDIATGCIFVHVAAQVVSAIDRRDWKMIGDAFRDLMSLAAKYQLDAEGIVATALNVALLAIQEVARPDLLIAFFDEGLARIEAQVMSHVSDMLKPFVKDVFDQFRAKRADIEREVRARAGQVISKLPVATPEQLANRTSDPNKVPHGPLDRSRPSGIPDPVGDKITTSGRRRFQAIARLVKERLGDEPKPPGPATAGWLQYNMRKTSLLSSLSFALAARRDSLDPQRRKLVEDYSRYYLAASGTDFNISALSNVPAPVKAAAGLGLIALAVKFLL